MGADVNISSRTQYTTPKIYPAPLF